LARARDRERYAANISVRREQSRVGARTWRQAHPEQSRAKARANNHAHLVRRRENEGRYRARRHGVGVAAVSERDLQALLERQVGRCAYCPNDLDHKRHLDHRTPLSRGGAHAIGNLCWTCPTCNRRKGQKTAEEFVEMAA
jgi:5-methylcytosine-specific restriction endonuclease McrA